MTQKAVEAPLIMNTKNIGLSSIIHNPLDCGSFVNQSLLLLCEKLKHNSQASPAWKKLVFWCQCSPCTLLLFATIRTSTRSQTEGVWAGESIKFWYLYQVFHRVKDIQPLYYLQSFLPLLFPFHAVTHGGF